MSYIFRFYVLPTKAINRMDEEQYPGVYGRYLLVSILGTISIIEAVSLFFLAHGIIWYERYGSDKKRTLINKLFADICYTMLAILVICLLDNLRFITGPLPLVSAQC